MSWVVDTCLVIDILDDDPQFGATAAALLDRRRGDGLVVCPVTYIELAPTFLGDGARQRDRRLCLNPPRPPHAQPE